MGMAKTKLARNRQDKNVVAAWYHLIWDKNGVLLNHIPQWLAGKLSMGSSLGLARVYNNEGWTCHYMHPAGKTTLTNDLYIVDRPAAIPLFVTPSGFAADWEPIEAGEGQVIPLNKESLDRLIHIESTLAHYGSFITAEHITSDGASPFPPESFAPKEQIARPIGKHPSIQPLNVAQAQELDALIMATLDRYSDSTLMAVLSARGYYFLDKKTLLRFQNESKALQSLREDVWRIARKFDQGIEEAASAAEETKPGVYGRSSDRFGNPYGDRLVRAHDNSERVKSDRIQELVRRNYGLAEESDEAQGQDASPRTPKG